MGGFVTKYGTGGEFGALAPGAESLWTVLSERAAAGTPPIDGAHEPVGARGS